MDPLIKPEDLQILYLQGAVLTEEMLADAAQKVREASGFTTEDWLKVGISTRRTIRPGPDEELGLHLHTVKSREKPPCPLCVVKVETKARRWKL